MSIDLHLHTTASDGTIDPAEIVKMAAAAGLQTIALADHETTSGYVPALLEAQKLGVTILPAVELLTYYKDHEVHLLGYFQSPDNDYLQNKLAELRHCRTTCSKATVERLIEHGFKLRWSDIISQAQPDITVSKGHIMRALRNAGYITSREQAIKFLAEYLNRDGLAYIAHDFSFEEGVKLIAEAGGIPVLAHPGLIWNDEIVNELCDRGIMGIEVFYYYFGPNREELIENYNKLATGKKILKTGGTDYHGQISSIQPGCQYVPFEEVKDFLYLFGIK
ncbi:MAG: PHP domain-containing protein [Thermincola sp.]|nr:PHP domain-containing protein [Thermincola sp.]MDT3703875.1 PHP domain-containing protein [Thermincola sp.]